MVFGFFIYALTPKVISLKKGEDFKVKSENHFVKSIYKFVLILKRMLDSRCLILGI